MKTRHLQCARLFAAGLMSAALAVPAAAAVGGPFGQRVPGVIPAEIAFVRVTDPLDLKSKLEAGFNRIIIAKDMDLSGLRDIPLKSGAWLIGERGALGSRPRLSTKTPFFIDENGKKQGYALFVVEGKDVRVEGIHFQGPANTDQNRSSSQARVKAIYIIQNNSADPTKQRGLSVVVADCEFNEWTKSGVQVELELGSPLLEPKDAGLVRVERNYLHHNATNGDGYGVGVSRGSYVTIEGNVFDFNRHAVGAEWHCGGYIARYNYVLQGGYTEDGFLGANYYNQHFDVHGQYDGYGGQAGVSFEIVSNTIRGAQSYHAGFSTRPALLLRGTPEKGLRFNGNVLVHDNHDDAISFKGGLAPGGNRALTLLDLIRAGKYDASGNQYDTDYSTELATGDFDGDGRTDAFVATGTAWFFSRGGQRPWEFLQASIFRTGDLGFADIDNDRITDVLWQLRDGSIEYSKSGTGYPTRLTNAPVPMKDLRFGDFDGDGKTDIFYTQAGQWHIWYGRTGRWTATLGAALPVTELLFGEFDSVRGTDLVAALPNDWACSSGAAAAWVKLNERRKNSFANAVAADFDGNGRSDIAFNDGGKWWFSRDGNSPLALLRDGGDDTIVYRNASLKAMLVGAFDGGRRAKVVRFNHGVGDLFNSTRDEKLWIWRGLGSGNAFNTHSERNMR